MAERMLSKEAQALLTPCPKCEGRDQLQAVSDRCAEDCFGVFIACKRCENYFPGTFMDHVETVWGMEEWAVRAAMDIWNEQLVAP
jgi:hypothetical protein